MNKFLPILFVIIPLVGAIGAGFTLIKFIGEGSQSQPEPATRFYAVNESEIFYGKPVSYRIILENQEGETIDYEMKVRLSEKEIYNKSIKLSSGSIFNQAISFTPDLADSYPRLEFLLYKNNEIYRTFVSQIIPAINYSLEPNTTVTTALQNGDGTGNIKKDTEPYTKLKIGDIILYKFDTGETLELKILNGSVKPEDAIYTTASDGNKIILLGETYEKTLPNMGNFLYPIILDMKDEKLKINETLKIKEGYAVTLEKIENQSLQINISKNNRIVRSVMAAGNSSIEYWNETDDYKKYKMIIIYPKQVNQDELVFDIIQYGDEKVVRVGDKYGEFQVTDVDNNTIIMKNLQPIKIETKEVISLIDGKIKIRV